MLGTNKEINLKIKIILISELFKFLSKNGFLIPTYIRFIISQTNIILSRRRINHISNKEINSLQSQQSPKKWQNKFFGFRIQGLGFSIQGSGFRVQGLGFGSPEPYTHPMLGEPNFPDERCEGSVEGWECQTSFLPQRIFRPPYLYPNS